MELFLNLVITFLFGLIVGSFLNVCIYRIPLGESIVFPASHCPSCQHRLSVKDLFPLISFCLLGGQCRYCGERIHWQYPAIELANALGWVSILLLFAGKFTEQSIAGALLYSFSLVLALIDIKHYVIPNRLVLILLLGGVIFHVFRSDVHLLRLLVGMIIGFSLPLAIALLSRGGMGGGDIKLCAAMGLWLGYPAILYAMFIGALLGSLIGILLILCKIKSRKDRIPFGPFLMLGFLITFFFEKQIMCWYSSIIG